MEMSAFYWFIFAVIGLVLEMLTLGLTTIWFSGGALAAAVCALLHFPLIAQILVFVLVTVILLLLTRPLAVKYLNSKTVKTNVDSLIGQKCIVTKQIDNLRASGEVSLKGRIWTARSQDEDLLIPPNAIVKVERISGVKVIVSIVSLPEKVLPKMEDLE